MSDSISLLVDVALRSSIILAAIFAVITAMRRASAAERHFVLLLGLAVVALLPVIIEISPKVIVPVPMPWASQVREVIVTAPATFLKSGPDLSPLVSSAPSPIQVPVERVFSSGELLIFLLLTGMLVQILFLVRSAWAWGKTRGTATRINLTGEALSRAQVFAGPKGVPPVYLSEHVKVPVLAGWWRPVMVLPLEARDWPVSRLALVLCHEIAHFRRGDFWVLPVCALLQVVYWWHPLVWLALARLRRERESACDDLVLDQDICATDYAELIVVTARHARFDSAWSATALAMAASSSLSDRISSILDPSTRRRTPSRKMIFVGCGLALLFGWFIEAAKVQAMDNPASIKTAGESQPHIQLEFKLIEIDQKTYAQQQKEIDAALDKGDVAYFNHQGMEILAAPNVTTLPGQKAEVDIVKEFPFATRLEKDKNGQMVPSDFKSRNLGIMVEATPALEPDGQSVRLKLKCEYTSFEGWVDDPAAAARQPIFNVRRFTGERVVAGYDHLWMGSPPSGQSPKSFVLLIHTKQVDENGAPMGIAKPPGVEGKIVTEHAANPADASKPQIDVQVKLVEIDEKVYQQQTASINEALKKGDVSFFINLKGASVLAAPSVTTSSGLNVEISMGKELVQGNNSTPVTTLTAHPEVGANGVTTAGKITTSTTMGPSRSFLGLGFGAKPSLSADGTIQLSFFCKIGEVLSYKDAANYELGVPMVKEELKATDGKNYGYWMGEQHPFSLLNLLGSSNAEELKALPPLSSSPNRLALIVTARRVTPPPAAYFTRTILTAPPSARPAVKFHLALVEVMEKDYQREAGAMDEAIVKGDLDFFTQRKDLFRSAEVYLHVGQPGWYSEGKIQTNVASVPVGKGKAGKMMFAESNPVFLGTNANFSWSKDGTLLDTAWQITVPHDSSNPPYSPEAALNAMPGNRVHITSFTDKAWDMTPGKAHAYWIGETYGWEKFWTQGKRSFDEIAQSKESSRLAVFMTVQPMEN